MLHILVVDDSPADREVIRRLLGGCPRPLRVSEAQSGTDALRACLEGTEGPPDCVLLDYYLPDYEAPELLAARGSPDWPCCAVVVLTAHPCFIDHRAMVRQGALLEGLVALLTHAALDQGLRLVVAVAPELAARPFLGDAQRRSQVLMNLVGNAIKFSNQGQVLVSGQHHGW